MLVVILLFSGQLVSHGEILNLQNFLLNMDELLCKRMNIFTGFKVCHCVYSLFKVISLLSKYHLKTRFAGPINLFDFVPLPSILLDRMRNFCISLATKLCISLMSSRAFFSDSSVFSLLNFVTFLLNVE